jgi:FKBP-type peptidyl-prolyl cis-trans isomerase FkpA
MTAAIVSASMRRSAAIGQSALLQLSHHNRIVMKLIHLTGAAAVFTVFALTAPSWLSPAMAQGAQGKMSELPSGLKYTDSKVGDGTAATAGHKVNVHCTGWLTITAEGQEARQLARPRRPFSFTLGGGQVIKGWDQGVAGMKVGGKRTLVIPPGSAMAWCRRRHPAERDPDLRCRTLKVD